MDNEHKNVVFYPTKEEIINNPKFIIKSDTTQVPENAINIICDYVGISKDKLLFFVKNFGISRIFDETSIMGLTPEQEQKFKELKILLSEEG